MNLPKGNAIALQQLRPVENKTGDILSEITFQLVKEKKAKDAAELKSMVDSGATMDDIINKINPKYANTLYQLQPKLNEQADNIMNLKAEYGSIGVTDTKEKLARKRELSNQIAISNAEYERAQTFLANPNTNEMLTEKLKLLSEGKLFEGDPSTAALKSFASGILIQKRGDDGRFYVEYPENASIPFKDSNKVTKNITDYFDSILLTQKDVTDQVIKDAKTFNKTKDVTIGTDNGFRKNVTQRLVFDKDSNRKSIMVYFGLDPEKPIKEQFINPDTLSQNLKQYFYKYVGDKSNISSGEDIEKAVDSYLELAKANANEKYSNVTDVNLPSSSGSGGSSGGKNYEILTGGNVVRKMSDGTVEVKNSVVVDLKDKGQIMGIKVPNKNNKGFHIEYAILGKDKFGRSAYERITQKSDAVAKLISQKLDPNLFESLVMKQNAAQYTAIKEKDDIGTIKYYNASTSSNSQSDEEDPNMQ